jgi:murein DD-endopeptidase MepM/ murein hydrolase activator NlpD
VSRATLPVALVCLSLALPWTTVLSQTAYRYRDANGQWVFTDRATTSAPAAGSFNLKHDETALHIAVERKDSAASTQLVAINDCLCVVSFQLAVLRPGEPAVRIGPVYEATLEPGTSRTLADLPLNRTDQNTLRYEWRAALGSPQAVHNPSRPYRVPFAIGATYTITQAYPMRISHTTPESEYAVDIAVPDGTPIYAAREGTVIQVRHDSFSGSTAPVMLDQANIVEILHADGTIALYGHLHWDSIRVRIGQHVARGEYLADSGNTGLSSGPHLHFGVIRNSGTENVSVPIEFAGAGGIAITPTTHLPLTAY